VGTLRTRPATACLWAGLRSAHWMQRFGGDRDCLSLKLAAPSFGVRIYAKIFDDEDGERLCLARGSLRCILPCCTARNSSGDKFPALVIAPFPEARQMLSSTTSKLAVVGVSNFRMASSDNNVIESKMQPNARRQTGSPPQPISRHFEELSHATISPPFPHRPRGRRR
jgi:hypothetical protein